MVERLRRSDFPSFDTPTGVSGLFTLIHHPVDRSQKNSSLLQKPEFSDESEIFPKYRPWNCRRMEGACGCAGVALHTGPVRGKQAAHLMDQCNDAAQRQ